MQQGIYSDFPLKRLFHYEWARLWRTDSIILCAIFFIIVFFIGFGSSFAGNDDRRGNDQSLMDCHLWADYSRYFSLFLVWEAITRKALFAKD
jgi:hypothetical protein